MTRRNGHSNELNNLVKDAQDTLDKAGKQAGRAAGDFRKKAAKQLQDTSDQIRDQLKRSHIDDDAREQVDRVLSRVEEVRDYLENGGIEDIEEKARVAAQSNVWRSMVIAFVAGAFIGIFLSSRR
jgi:ElaB/YqjD/DUF883 family membrane-anchored ribosome-binding protein